MRLVFFKRIELICQVSRIYLNCKSDTVTREVCIIFRFEISFCADDKLVELLC